MAGQQWKQENRLISQCDQMSFQLQYFILYIRAILASTILCQSSRFPPYFQVASYTNKLDRNAKIARTTDIGNHSSCAPANARMTTTTTNSRVVILISLARDRFRMKEWVQIVNISTLMLEVEERGSRQRNVPRVEYSPA